MFHHPIDHVDGGLRTCDPKTARRNYGRLFAAKLLFSQNFPSIELGLSSFETSIPYSNTKQNTHPLPATRNPRIPHHGRLPHSLPAHATPHPGPPPHAPNRAKPTQNLPVPNLHKSAPAPGRPPIQHRNPILRQLRPHRRPRAASPVANRSRPARREPRARNAGRARGCFRRGNARCWDSARGRQAGGCGD